MKHNTFLIAIFLFFCLRMNAQQFISNGIIEYEVKTNIKKTMGNNSFDEMIKDKLPEFKISYYHLSFTEGNTLLLFDHWNEKSKIPEYFKRDEDENKWYLDFTSRKIKIQKSIFGNRLEVDDSIPVIKWKLVNEYKMIGGFNCRKAVGKIFDSVYVFAFYTDEIIVPGGPCSISGLPGMILGLTIPRMYTSWIATKIILNDKPDSFKYSTGKKTYKISEMRKAILDNTKDWYNSEDENDRKWREQTLWRTML
jgi:GLPGLI family protein